MDNITQVPTPESPSPAATAAPPVPQQEVPSEPSPADDTPKPVQVDESVYLAARLREVMAEAANLRQVVAELQLENSRLRAVQDQREINDLDKSYNVGSGTVLQKRPDGTYWRIPRELLQQSQG